MRMNSTPFHDDVQISVLALFKAREDVEKAYDELREAGFRKTDIVAFLDDSHTDKTFKHVIRSQSAEWAGLGFAFGTPVGGILGYLVGMEGNIEEVVGFGPVITGLIGLAVGSNLGALVGGFIGHYFPIFVALRFSGVTDNAGILISVHCDSKEWIKKAKLLLKKSRADSITTMKEVQC